MTDWLVGTLFATSALVLLVLLLREPVRRRFGSRVTYCLWLIPAARLFMPTVTRTVERGAPDPVFHALTRPIVGEPLLLANVAVPEPSMIVRAGGWTPIILALWLAVAFVLFVSRMIAFHRDRRAILASSEGVARFGSLRIIRSPELLSPVAFGIFDRVIAVPFDFDRSYGERERHFALEHELAHHRSGDLIANYVAFVLLCLQWFNPLAWVAHAAFRFDQEAACDARVLDKAAARDRADYGRAIAKAASGRALLFASALDRRNTLHRRLQSMLNNPNPRRPLAGRLLVGVAIAVAMPLTASRAVEYVDKPAPALPAVPSIAAPVRAPALAAAVAVQAAAPARPAAPAAAGTRRGGDLTINEDRVIIDGKTKRWEELTPAEKDLVRDAVAKARTALANAHFDGWKVSEEVARATSQLRSGDMQRDLVRAQANVAQAMRDLDANAADLQRSGQDSNQIRATVRESLRAVQQVDWQAANKALEAIDQVRIAQSLAGADEGMRAARAELDRLELKMRKDRQ